VGTEEALGGHWTARFERSTLGVHVRYRDRASVPGLRRRHPTDHCGVVVPRVLAVG